MKSTVVEREVKANFDPLDRKNFQIAVNHKSYRILLDTLYSNKILAPIRELWTNAYDSHVAAGKADVPFDCQLPSLLDQTFYVRDYGVSMTHEEIMGLYTTLFDSSKDESNEYVGMLGLGSKSPFAYTDTFVVTAYLNGEARTYIASLDTDSIPEMIHLETVETDEPNGLKVSFSAKINDANKFIEEAQKVSAGFHPAPNIFGAEVFQPEVILEHDNWKLFRGMKGISIKQGCVIYPYQVYGNPPGFVIDVPIGSVEIAANRESLSLNKQTQQFLDEEVANAIASFHAHLQKTVSEAPNLLAAVKVAMPIKSQYHVNLKYRGESLSPYSIKFDPFNRFKVLNRQWKEVAKPSVHCEHFDKLRIIIDRSDIKIPRRRLRARRYLENNTSDSYGFILVDPDKRDLSSLIRRLGLTSKNFISSSQLPDVDVERTKRDPSLPKMDASGVYVPKETYEDRLVKVTENEIQKDFVWFPIQKGADMLFFFLGRSYSSKNCFWLVDTLKSIGLIPEVEVYALTPRPAGKASPNKMLEKVIKDSYDADPEGFKEKLIVCQAALECKRWSRNSPPVYQELFEVDFDPTGDSREVLRILKAYTDFEWSSDDIQKVSDLSKKIKTDFPLLFEQNDENEIEYIKLKRGK